jgi:preprotein translocase subunit SecA
MLKGFVNKLVSTITRDKVTALAELVWDLETDMARLSDSRLRAKTAEFRNRLAAGESLDDLLPEAFAVVREAGKRTLNQRHFDVQVMGGIALHQGKIIEMKTGEGKTLVSTLPAYLNGLAGKGVHIVTVNDYLARRDADWMGAIYKFLGFTIGVLQHDMDDAVRKEAYRADITYGTNNEFGFDYLRDNLKARLEDCCQRDLNFAIVDEVDNILIDEARTPLIISGPAGTSTEEFRRANALVPHLEREKHYQIDEKARTATLTEEGVERVEQLLNITNLYAPENVNMVHQLYQCLRAHVLFRRDVDYIVESREIIIVDEFTGRKMPGRRYSDGLHQALEAKENLPIQQENQTLASITLQNYFRMYKKLAGMTGTAASEAEEFQKVYGREVAVIPTNEAMVRKDMDDVIYRYQKDKFGAVIEDILRCHDAGRPVLVGTTSVETSELLAIQLKKRGVDGFDVLNAKQHEKEAGIIKHAGRKGAITIATNMAGRGVDIMLGPGVRDLGGLHVIGTERHESRRIDNQLRGRSGRQGDPGSSRFYLSLEDDLVRIFAGDRITGIMDRIGFDEGQTIEHSLITKSIERAQKKVEGQNFEIRKHLLEYDNVMNQQRSAFYAFRRQVLEERLGEGYVLGVARDHVDRMLDDHAPEKKDPREWALDELAREFLYLFGIVLREHADVVWKLDPEELRGELLNFWQKDYAGRTAPELQNALVDLRSENLETIGEKEMAALFQKRIEESLEGLPSDRLRERLDSLESGRLEAMSEKAIREKIMAMLEGKYEKAPVARLKDEIGRRTGEKPGDVDEEALLDEVLALEEADLRELGEGDLKKKYRQMRADKWRSLTAQDLRREIALVEEETREAEGDMRDEIVRMEKERLAHAPLARLQEFLLGFLHEKTVHLPQNELRRQLLERVLDQTRTLPVSDLRREGAELSMRKVRSLSPARLFEKLDALRQAAPAGSDAEALKTLVEEECRVLDPGLIRREARTIHEKYEDRLSKGAQEGMLDILESSDLTAEDLLLQVEEMGGDPETRLPDEMEREIRDFALKDAEGATAEKARSALLSAAGREWEEMPEADLLPKVEALLRERYDVPSFPELREALYWLVVRKYREKRQQIGWDNMRRHERYVILEVADSIWYDYLNAVDHLREGIGLRGYAQRDPLVEYKRESFEMFRNMMETVQVNIVRYLFLFKPSKEALEMDRKRDQKYIISAGGEEKAKTVKRVHKKIGRNDPCPCGSGKKYKKCCGA